MRTRNFLGLLVLGTGVAAWACGSDTSNETPPPTDVDSGSSSSGNLVPGPDPQFPPPVPADFGIDTRPVNSTCIPKAKPAARTGVRYNPAFGGAKFNQPIDMHIASGDDANVYIAERGGSIQRVNRQTGAKTEFLRIPSEQINPQGEGGLLGFAFHPDWASGKQEVFVSYTAPSDGPAKMKSVVERFTSTNGGQSLAGATRKVVFELEQPYTNHNGGGIAFGRDGFLYIGLGDGGSGGDPLNAGQDKQTLLGKFLRIDINGVEGGKQYRIPATNPFATGGGKPEIFAYGLRNPWRWSFDTATGDLWAGDVGQGQWEEVDIIKLGGNYGWRVREGRHCYNAANCDSRGMIDPIAEHDRNDARSITGGYVYRGKRLPGLVGKFIYGDFATGKVWAVEDQGGGTGTPVSLGSIEGNELASFGQDQDGEVYLLKLQSGTINVIAPAGAETPSDFPTKLSATGCVDPANPKLPAAGLIPYGPVAPFWSDGAEKERYFALPEGGKIRVGQNGDLEFPNNTVLVKTFYLGGKRIETRLFIRHADGEWAGYSYEWNDAQSDAILLEGSKNKVIGSQTWSYPSRTQCLQCHTAAAGYSLGLEIAQLNSSFTYRAQGRIADQLKTLEHIGVFEAPLGDRAMLPKLASPTDVAAPIQDRARAYLHTNCANCHRPQGGARGNLDLRFSAPLADSKVCDKATLGELGVQDARIVSPGKPGQSIMPLRMKSTDVNRMPNLSSNVVDQDGVKLIEQWIGEMKSCP
jgi:uncharacterized repeat protein (TIGR03806 family)